MKKSILSLCMALAVTLTAMTGYSEDYTPTASMKYKLGNNRTIYSPEIFMPLASDDRSLLFADLRSVISIPTAQEYNVGLGYRYFLNSDLIGGVYGFYDRRNSPNGNKFNQITAGGELLAERWDARVNTYVPLTRDAKFAEGTTSTVNPAGTGIFMTNGFSYEQALDGADIEFGYKPFAAIPVRVFGGGYWFEGGDAPTIKGTRARVELQAHRFLRLGGEMQYDHVRGHNSFLEARVTLPLSLEEILRPKPLDAMRERMTTPIVRDIDIVTAEESSNRYVTTALTTTDGTTSRILYVDNSGSNGDGSYESPYNNLSDAVASSTSGTVIYIREGNGTATGLTSAYTLSANGVKLLGAGDAYTLSDLGLQVSDPNNVLSSSYQLFDADGAPVLSSAGTALTITGNSVTVAGLTVSGTTAGGIVFTNTNGLTVRDVSLTNIGGTAISGSIANMASSIRIEDSRIVSTSGNAISLLGNGTSSLSLIIQDNMVSSSLANAVNLTFSNTSSSVVLANNRLLSNGDSQSDNAVMLTTSGTAGVSFTLISSSITGNAGRGLHVKAGGASSLNLNVTSNTISSNYFDGIRIAEGDGVETGVTVTGSITSNTLNNALTTNSVEPDIDSVGLVLKMSQNMTAGSASNRFLIQGNTMSNNSEDGVDIWAFGGTIYAELSDNVMHNNEDDGAEIRSQTATTDGYLDLNVYRNIASGGSESGIQLDSSSGNSTIVAHIASNTTYNNTVKGLFIGLNASSTGVVGTVAAPIIIENNISYGNGVGIQVRADTGASGSLVTTISNNTIYNNNHGIQIQNDLSNTIVANITGNIISSSLTNGVRLDTAGTASTTLNLTNNTIVSSTSIQVFIQNNAAASTTLNVVSNTISLGGDDAINITSYTSSTLLGQISSNTIASNKDYGITVTARDASGTMGLAANPFVIANNRITNNSNTNVYLRTSAGANPRIYTNMYGNIISGSNQRGIDINEFDSATGTNNIIVDLGGGLYSSIGNNQILNNAGYNVFYNPDIASSVLKAENNWWGQDADPASFDEASDSDGFNEFGFSNSGAIDASPRLSTSP